MESSENPIAFLTQARNDVQQYEIVETELQQKSAEEKRAEAAVERLKTEIREKIEKTIQTRQSELTASYDKRLADADQRLKKTNQEREKARKEGVRGRIKAETDPWKLQITELKRQMLAVIKRDNAPRFYGSDAFYVIFRPSGIVEILQFLLIFTIIFAVFPFAVYCCIPDKRLWMLFGIYILDIMFFGGLYVLISTRSAGKYAEVIHTGRGIKNRMRQCRGEIRKITREILNDSNESGYHLENFDDEIAKIQQERRDIISQKQSAQNTFDSVTKTIIADEIEAGAKEKSDELEMIRRSASAERNELEKKARDYALAITNQYHTVLGTQHACVKDIDALLEMLQNGSAVSLYDAISKLEYPEGGKKPEN